MTTSTQAANGKACTAPLRPDRPPPPKIDNIPAELRERPQWVVWSHTLRHGQWAKIPYQAKAPRSGAKADEPSTWSTFDEAWDRYQRGGFDGIGYEFSTDDPYFGVDVDKCLLQRQLLDWAVPIVQTLHRTYGEVSPSGTGIKFFARGKLPSEKGAHRSRMGPDERGGLELYDHGRYFALTGEVFGGSPEIVELQDTAEALYALAKERSGPKLTSERGQTSTSTSGSSIEKRARAYIAKIDPAVSGDGGHDRAFYAACKVGPGFNLTPDEAFRLLWEDYNPRCKPEWSEADLRHKVDDAYKEEPRRGWLLEQKPLSSNGHGYGPRLSSNGHGSSPPANGHSGNCDGDKAPQIEVSPKRHAVLAETIKAIVKDPDLYCRGETLGVVIQEQDDTANLASGIDLSNARGSLRFFPLAQSVLGCRLTKCASFYRWKIDDKGEAKGVDCHPPDWLISAVADHRYWHGVRELLSIAEVPYVLADGSMMSPGFDRRTGTLYRSSITIPVLPNRPTLQNAEDARDRTFDLVSQFPFENRNSFAVWLANLLTAIQRPSIKGPVPGFAYNGNKAGCGKGLLIDIIGNIVWGCDVSTRAYPIDPNEADKVKLALALAAVPMVHFDNLPEGGFYGGSTIDSALTSTVTSGRILGLSRDSGNVPIRPVWTLSGNNVSPTGDADRRWLPIDLVTNEESPHERSDIEHKDLRGYVLNRRGELLRDCYLILKAHALAGRPTGEWGALGSFEEWDPIVRGAVWWVTGIDCLTTQRNRAKKMPDRINKTALLEGWKELDPEREGKTVQEALDAVNGDNAARYATLKSAFMAISKDGKLPSVTRIGAKLRAMKKTPIGRMCFEKCGETRDGAVAWRVIKV
jgi:hypothetical protein